MAFCLDCSQHVLAISNNNVKPQRGGDHLEPCSVERPTTSATRWTSMCPTSSLDRTVSHASDNVQNSRVRNFLQRSSFLSQRGDLERLQQRQVAAAGSSRQGWSSPQALFTGIVEEMGKVRKLELINGSWELTVEASQVLEDVKLGDSIAVNGTCLTVTTFDSNSFVVGLSPETLRKTSLEELEPGSGVNLERSLRPDSRMGGHFVQGHVDGTGTIASFREEGDSLWVTVKTSAELLRYIVPKGYIAVDGTSLTVVDVLDQSSSFTFMLVAYTQSKIVVALKKPGDKVNLEVDIVGKYVERMLQGYRVREFAADAEAVAEVKVGDWGSLQ